MGLEPPRLPMVQDFPLNVSVPRWSLFPEKAEQARFGVEPEVRLTFAGIGPVTASALGNKSQKNPGLSADVQQNINALVNKLLEREEQGSPLQWYPTGSGVA